MKRSILLRGWVFAVLAFVAAAAQAANPDVELGMVLTGVIAVNPDGGVRAWTLDQRDGLPPAVVQLVRDEVPGWKFDPVLAGGKPVLAKTRMALRVVADPVDATHWRIRIAGARFGRDVGLPGARSNCASNACIGFARHHPPRYPVDMGVHGIGATVYLVQEIGRDGTVTREAVRQVNLDEAGQPEQMAFWRHEFAEVSLAGARDWTYHVPTVGDQAGKEHWVVVIPIHYALLRPNRPLSHAMAGGWDAYVPGPVLDIPWEHDANAGSGNGSADAVPANGKPFLPDPRFTLLTRLDGDTGQRQAAAAGR